MPELLDDDRAARDNARAHHAAESMLTAGGVRQIAGEREKLRMPGAHAGAGAIGRLSPSQRSTHFRILSRIAGCRDDLTLSVAHYSTNVKRA